ncbi:hypothetical protein ACFGVR_15325 [Mucilaginibacter sp. AW1-3]
MKKLLLATILAVAFYSQSLAQTNVSPDTTAIGIGATSYVWPYKFPYQNHHIAYYGLGWHTDAEQQHGGYMAYLSGWSGIKFFTDELPRMTIKQDGSVGIGTNTPGYKLEITGSTGGRGLMGNGSMGQYYEILPYEIGSHNNAGWSGTMFGVRTGGLNSASKPLTQNVSANSSDYQQAWAMTFSSDKNASNGAAFSLWSADATTPNTEMSEVFRVQSNGAVGINTNYIPSGYQLAVNGTVIFTQAYVQLRGSWPDYVFKKGYQLRPLSEVKSYIDQNQHLPDMPDAATVKKEGLNLGEINKALLKKVEELTLYLIEKDEKVAELEKLSKEQKTLMAIQEARLKKIETALRQIAGK